MVLPCGQGWKDTPEGGAQGTKCPMTLKRPCGTAERSGADAGTGKGEAGSISAWMKPKALRRKGDDMWSNPMFSFAVFMILFGIGSIISKKTKGIIVEALFLSVIYMIGFITGIFPQNALEITGIPAMMSAFGTLLIVTNLGTLIELRRFVREWKTVVITLGAMAVMGVFFCTVGIFLFGKYYALSALPPVAGGIVAAGLVINEAEMAGLSQYGAFASMVCSLQTFVGIPLCALLLRKYCDKIKKDGSYRNGGAPVNEEQHAHKKLIGKFPDALNSGTMIVARLLIVAVLGLFISNLTGGALPAAVVVLILGTIFTEIGFLETQTLAKARYMDFLLMGLIMTLPHGFRTLTISSFGEMFPIVVFFLLLGAVGLIIGGAVFGKILRTDWRLSGAIALCAMLGYPLTEMVARSVTESYGLPKEETEKLLESVLPQLIIAGFASVTVASVALAGFVAPMIFR